MYYLDNDESIVCKFKNKVICKIQKINDNEEMCKLCGNIVNKKSIKYHIWRMHTVNGQKYHESLKKIL